MIRQGQSIIRMPSILRHSLIIFFMVSPFIYELVPSGGRATLHKAGAVFFNQLYGGRVVELDLIKPVRKGGGSFISAIIIPVFKLPDVVLLCVFFNTQWDGAIVRWLAACPGIPAFAYMRALDVVPACNQAGEAGDPSPIVLAFENVLLIYHVILSYSKSHDLYVLRFLGRLCFRGP